MPHAPLPPRTLRTAWGPRGRRPRGTEHVANRFRSTPINPQRPSPKFSELFDASIPSAVRLLWWVFLLLPCLLVVFIDRFYNRIQFSLAHTVFFIGPL